MYFGLCNSPATFQLMMDSLFQDLVNEGKIVIYMDDIPDLLENPDRTQCDYEKSAKDPEQQ